LPPTLLERVLFYLARERFEEGIDQQLEFFSTFIGGLAANAGDLVRDAHNRAITSLDTHGERGAELSSFSWTVEAAVTAPAVLPDCVALSYAADGTALPFMYAGIGMQSVVMPLSRNRLLVGRRSGGVLPDLAAFNRHAAACSHQFFLAETDAPNIAALGALIDSRAGDYLGETLGKELAETLPQHVAKPDRLCGPEAVSPKLGDGGVDCRITCIGCATSTAEQIIDAAKTVIGGLSDMLPMARLDGVLFAADYPAALASIDRGDPALPPPQTIDSDQGEGIGQMVVVIREGEVRGLIVLHLSIGKQLAGEAGYPRDWALHLLAYELVLVAMIEWFDGALPGRLLRSVGTLLEGALYAQVDAALNGYVASRLSAGFGDAYAIAAGHREQLATALDRLRGLGLPQRLAYRLHGDMDRLLSVVLPAVAAVLDSAAALIGHAQASELPVLDDEGELRAALDRAGLGWWLADYWEDLERLWRGLGQWSSFDEFLAFNRHVERLMWSVGLFPCEGPGGPRIEIPLITDAAVLEGARP
jgi:hypothetical protein